MLTRLAACFLSVGLLGSAASAHAPRRFDVNALIEVRLDVDPDRAKVKLALAKRRAKNLATFRAYRTGGVYPHNTVRVGPLNIWIDREGHLCAAATMISKDGKHELVVEIGKTDNFIRLQNVTSGPLLDWIMTSGFTIEEIDRIQMPAIHPDFPLVRAPDYAAEDARLAKQYARTDRWLVLNAKDSLERAVDRVMKLPALANKLVAGTI